MWRVPERGGRSTYVCMAASVRRSGVVSGVKSSCLHVSMPMISAAGLLWCMWSLQSQLAAALQPFCDGRGWIAGIQSAVALVPSPFGERCRTRLRTFPRAVWCLWPFLPLPKREPRESRTNPTRLTLPTELTHTAAPELPAVDQRERAPSLSAWVHPAQVPPPPAADAHALNPHNCIFFCVSRSSRCRLLARPSHR